MDYLKPPFTFVSRFDLVARRTSLSSFIGRNPFAVSVNAAGIVDMSEFMTTCQAVSLDMPAADSNALLECNQFHGQDFRTMFTALVVMAYTSKSQWFLVFCGQNAYVSNSRFGIEIHDAGPADGDDRQATGRSTIRFRCVRQGD